MMNNGDYITGEVKKLQFGILFFKTDDMGTLQIEWEKVMHVISKDYFEVELQDFLAPWIQLTPEGKY